MTRVLSTGAIERSSDNLSQIKVEVKPCGKGMMGPRKPVFEEKIESRIQKDERR
jgi:hypothetical protein